MRGLDALKARVRRLSPDPPRITPWPPKEGSFSFCMWERLGRPAEKMSFTEMLEATSEKVWSEDGKQ